GSSRGRHRRGVRGDQLRDRRADSGPGSRPRRSRDQRQLVVRDGAGGLSLLRVPEPHQRIGQLAARLPDRRDPRAGHPHDPPVHPREPALASHPRSRGRGGGDRRRDRGLGAQDASAAAGAQGEPIAVEQRQHINFLDISKYVIKNYPSRGVLGLSLMIGQAFLYNAIFFTYTLVLTDFFNVKASNAPLYLIPFAVGTVAGPLLLGPLFDSIGRRVMISFTYIASGVLLIITGVLFTQGALRATTM